MKRAQHYKYYEGEAAGLARGEAAGLARGRGEGRTEGLAEGAVKGRAETLLKQLQLKFGRPSADTRQRVATASAEQLDAWLAAVLTADSPGEVFASKPKR